MSAENQDGIYPVTDLTIIVRRALVTDAPALPDIERSAAQLLRGDPSLAWLADSPMPNTINRQ